MWLTPLDSKLRAIAMVNNDYSAGKKSTEFHLFGAPAKQMQLTVKDSIMVQTVKEADLQFRITLADFSSPISFLASQPLPMSWMVLNLSNGIHFTLDGLGESYLGKGMMRFIHSQQRPVHKVVFPAGQSVLLSISVDVERLHNKGSYLMPFEYYYEQIKAADASSFQQAPIPVSDGIKLWLQRLVRGNYSKEEDCGLLREASDHLFDLYCSELRKLRRDDYMHDGHVREMEMVMPWLQAMVSRNTIGIPELMGKMNASDYTVRKIFKSILDVSPSQFVHEMRLGLLRDRLLLDREPVIRIANKMGMQYDWAMKNFSDRYGQKTREFRHWRGLWFPGQEEGDRPI